MAADRCAARVLRTHPLGETSLIVVLLTDAHGIVRAVAKGARDQKSRYRGLLEAGTSLDVLVHRRSRGGLDLLGEAGLRGRLPRSAPRLETLALRMAALELVQAGSEEGEPVAGLFELLEDYLSIFDGEEEGYAPLFAFEAGLLKLHGVAPDPRACGLCGRALAGEAFRFLPGDGLFACTRCSAEGIDLARAEGDWLHSIFLARPSALRGRLLPEDARRRIGKVLHLALGRHLPGYRLPRSLALLGRLAAERETESPGDP